MPKCAVEGISLSRDRLCAQTVRYNEWMTQTHNAKTNEYKF